MLKGEKQGVPQASGTFFIKAIHVPFGNVGDNGESIARHELRILFLLSLSGFSIHVYVYHQTRNTWRTSVSTPISYFPPSLASLHPTEWHLGRFLYMLVVLHRATTLASYTLPRSSWLTLSYPWRLNLTEVVFYTISVTTNAGVWSVCKRFSQFENLQTHLVANYSSALPLGAELPAKKFKLFVSHTSNSFIEERRCLLEAYLAKLVKVNDIQSSKFFRTWLETDKQDQKQESKKQIDLPDDVEVTGVCVPSTRSSICVTRTYI